MENRYIPSTTATVELAAYDLDHRDEDVMHALVTVGALVALADGQLEALERDELVNFIDQQGFVSTASKRTIAEAFDYQVQQLEDRYSPNVILEALRPLAGLSLASIVVRTAERVAAADRTIHPGELRSLKLIRLVMMILPAKRPIGSSTTRCKQ
jgi:tellurite resistance protein